MSRRCHLGNEAVRPANFGTHAHQGSFFLFVFGSSGAVNPGRTKKISCLLPCSGLATPDKAKEFVCPGLLTSHK